jgi:thiol-disulfide isomerase/thioredoxin
VLPDTVSLAGKVVYVDFWASWCAPCRLSFPWMQQIYEKYREKGFEIVAVSVDKDHNAALKFLKHSKATFTIVFDSTGELAKKLQLEAMPTSIIYDRGGRLVSKHSGFREEDTERLENSLARLINERKIE